MKDFGMVDLIYDADLLKRHYLMNVVQPFIDIWTWLMRFPFFKKITVLISTVLCFKIKFYGHVMHALSTYLLSFAIQSITG